MVNKVILLGHLGLDPELIVLESQQAICRMRLATSSPGRAESEQKQAEWHNIVAFGHLALNCAQFLHCGALVFIEGRLQTREYKTQDGHQHKVIEIIANIVRQVVASKNADNINIGEIVISPAE